MLRAALPARAMSYAGLHAAIITLTRHVIDQPLFIR